MDLRPEGTVLGIQAEKSAIRYYTAARMLNKALSPSIYDSRMCLIQLGSRIQTTDTPQTPNLITMRHFSVDPSPVTHLNIHHITY